MLPELANSLPMFPVGISVLRANNDDLEGGIISPIRWKHSCCQASSLRITQGQKHRHGFLHMIPEANVLLNDAPGCRSIGGCCRIPGMAKMLLNGVTHQLRLERSLALGLDSEPAFLSRCITDELHISSTHKPGQGLRPDLSLATETRLPAPFLLACQPVLPRWSYLRSRPVSFLPSVISLLAFSRSLFFFAVLRCFSLPLPIVCLSGSLRH